MIIIIDDNNIDECEGRDESFANVLTIIIIHNCVCIEYALWK